MAPRTVATAVAFQSSTAVAGTGAASPSGARGVPRAGLRRSRRQCDRQQGDRRGSHHPAGPKHRSSSARGRVLGTGLRNHRGCRRARAAGGDRENVAIDSNSRKSSGSRRRSPAQPGSPVRRRWRRFPRRRPRTRRAGTTRLVRPASVTGRHRRLRRLLQLPAGTDGQALRRFATAGRSATGSSGSGGTGAKAAGSWRPAAWMPTARRRRRGSSTTGWEGRSCS